MLMGVTNNIMKNSLAVELYSWQLGTNPCCTGSQVDFRLITSYRAGWMICVLLLVKAIVVPTFALLTRLNERAILCRQEP